MGISRIAVRSIPSWAATVGAMKHSGCEVMACCAECGFKVKPLPLDPIIARRGADFSLFDKRSPCPNKKCRGTVFFMYSGGAGTPYRPCRTIG
jgi:hypothetical protein